MNLVNTVNRKADSGELRLALAGMSANVIESLVRSGLRRRRLQSRYIDTEEVRAALTRAAWPEDEIEFALYRETPKETL